MRRLHTRLGKLDPRARQIELGGENVFAVCDILLFRILPQTKVKKAKNRNEDLTPGEDLPMRLAECSDERLAKMLTDDFCEFGSSEVIGASVQQRSVG